MRYLLAILAATIAVMLLFFLATEAWAYEAQSGVWDYGLGRVFPIHDPEGNAPYGCRLGAGIAEDGSCIEHPTQYWGSSGFTVVYIPVYPNGYALAEGSVPDYWERREVPWTEPKE